MLVLLIKDGERVLVGDIWMVAKTHKGQIQLAFDGPKSVNIIRESVLLKHAAMRRESEQQKAAS